MIGRVSRRTSRLALVGLALVGPACDRLTGGDATEETKTADAKPAEPTDEAAQLERKESVIDTEVVQNKCREDGIAVVELNSAETEKFKIATRTVYDKFQDYFTPGLLQKIINTKFLIYLIFKTN